MVEEKVRVISEQNDFVAVVYEVDKQWYIGKMVEVDEEDKEAYVTFMVADKSRTPLIFSWPNYEDKVWVKLNHILCEVSPPTPIGKSERSYKLKESMESFIEDIYAQTIIS